MPYSQVAIQLSMIVCFLCSGWPNVCSAQSDDVTAGVTKSTEKFSAAFNSGNVDAVVAIFLPQGELIDEDGTLYRGQEEIKELVSSFFKRYPGTEVSIEVESTRQVGPVVIQEGRRTMTLKKSETKSQFRYVAIWAKVDKEWKLVSLRDFTDNAIASPQENLQPIAWLVGEWINEGTDAVVAITYQWSEDRNFLLADFQIAAPGKPVTKSSQRIGWDPLARKIRSWLFDADGGFAEGNWTVVDDGLVIKSSSVNPDGGTASATMTFTTKDQDHFSIKGTERIVGDNREPDFEINIARRPPTVSK